MNPTTAKVLQRLAYEKLLLVSGGIARKCRISLTDLMQAGAEEPRIYAVLPALLLHKPKILFNIKRDLKTQPALSRTVDRLFHSHGKKQPFHGIPAEECQRAALTFQNYLQNARRSNRSRLFNLRLNEQDWERLGILSATLGTNNHSETIRRLIHEKTRSVSKAAPAR